jgi:hypothetical protein
LRGTSAPASRPSSTAESQARSLRRLSLSRSLSVRLRGPFKISPLGTCSTLQLRGPEHKRIVIYRTDRSAQKVGSKSAAQKRKHRRASSAPALRVLSTRSPARLRCSVKSPECKVNSFRSSLPIDGPNCPFAQSSLLWITANFAKKKLMKRWLSSLKISMRTGKIEGVPGVFPNDQGIRRRRVGSHLTAPSASPMGDDCFRASDRMRWSVATFAGTLASYRGSV